VGLLFSRLRSRDRRDVGLGSAGHGELSIR
jgi:hypothetical protein